MVQIFRGSRQGIPLADEPLFAEAGEQSLDNGRHQEDKYKIRRGTTGGMVFFNLSHGSSQELSFGITLFLHIYGGGLYTVAQLGQCPGHPFPDIY